jgi:hypothetical protein
MPQATSFVLHPHVPDPGQPGSAQQVVPGYAAWLQASVGPGCEADTVVHEQASAPFSHATL